MFFSPARKDQIHPGLLHHPFLCGIGHANPSAFTEAYSNGRTGVYHCADLPMAWHLLVGLHVPWPAMASKFPQTYIVYTHIYIYICHLQTYLCPYIARDGQALIYKVVPQRNFGDYVGTCC